MSGTTPDSPAVFSLILLRIDSLTMSFVCQVRYAVNCVCLRQTSYHMQTMCSKDASAGYWSVLKGTSLELQTGVLDGQKVQLDRKTWWWNDVANCVSKKVNYEGAETGRQK